MSRYVNTLALLAAIAGILTAAVSNIAPGFWLAGSLCFLAITGPLLFRNRVRWGWVLLLCIWCTAGFLFATARLNYRTELRRNQVYSGRDLTLAGVPVSRVTTSEISGRVSYRFTLAIRSPGPAGRITVYSREPFPAEWYGKRVRLSGRFKAATAQGIWYPGFSERKSLSGYLFLNAPARLVPGKGLVAPFLWANSLREALTRQGKQVLQPVNAELLHGMVYGTTMSEGIVIIRLVDQMKRTGTIHLISVSGLHVGLVVLTLLALCRFFRIPERYRILPVTLGIWFYILMTGMETPVLRAGLMIQLYLLGKLLKTQDEPVNRLSLAGLIILFLKPVNLFEIGFQLSFLATLGIIWLYPLLRTWLHPARLHRSTMGSKPAGGRSWPEFLVKPCRWVWEGFLASLAAQVMITPVIVHYYQTITWSSPIVNLFLLLPTELMVIGGLAGEFLGLGLAWCGRLVLVGVDWTTSLVRYILAFWAGQPWAASWSPRWPWPWFAGYYLAMLLLLDALRPNRLTGKRHWNPGPVFIGVLIALNLLTWTALLYRREQTYLRVAFIDVDQGDSIFVRTPAGINVLIDGGDKGKGRDRVLPFLQANGIERLDYIFASHGHWDHLGGLVEVVQELQVGRIYLTNEPDNPALQSLKIGIQNRYSQKMRVNQGFKLRLDSSVSLEVLLLPDPGNENDRSMVLLFGYGKNKLLLTGDLSVEGEEILQRKYPAALRATVLKVAHHGSNQASGLRFLTQVRPLLAVISVGEGNRYGHPGSRTLNRLRSLGVRVYRTDQFGTVDLKVYPERIRVRCESPPGFASDGRALSTATR